MSVDAAAWNYAAYRLNPAIATTHGITEADMIGFASVHGDWPERTAAMQAANPAKN